MAAGRRPLRQHPDAGRQVVEKAGLGAPREDNDGSDGGKDDRPVE